MNDLHLLVALGDDRYTLAVESVREVLRLNRAGPVPGAPATVLGVLNLRGEILPVLDCAALLGVAAGRPAAAVVVEHGRYRAALAVEAVVDVIELPLGLEPVDTPGLLGSTVSDGTMVGVIDVAALIEPSPVEQPA